MPLALVLNPHSISASVVHSSERELSNCSKFHFSQGHRLISVVCFVCTSLALCNNKPFLDKIALFLKIKRHIMAKINAVARGGGGVVVSELSN